MSQAYEGHEEDREKIWNALGGTRGLIDSGLPSIIFLIAFNIHHSVKSASLIAVIASLLFAVIRLIRRETLQHALSGLFGIGICALFAILLHSASGFFLPSLIKNSIFALLYLGANLFNYPLIGVILGPILGENMEWRNNPARLAAYKKAGWLWAGMFLIRLAVQFPLYLQNRLNLLGTANIFLGYPLYASVIWFTWRILRKVPAVKVTEPPQEDTL
mgnify:CR=1 FL=1